MSLWDFADKHPGYVALYILLLSMCVPSFEWVRRSSRKDDDK